MALDVEVMKELHNVESAIRESVGDLKDELISTIKFEVSQLATTITAIRAKQEGRDTHCASTTGRVATLEKAIEVIFKKLDDPNSRCTGCNNDVRIAKMETILNLMLWVGAAMATTMLGLVGKAVFDAVVHK